MDQPFFLRFVDDNLSPGSPFHLCISHDVVNMAMGIDDIGDFDPEFLGLLDQHLGLIGRVDYQTLTGLLVPNEVGENGEAPDFILSQYHLSTLGHSLLKESGLGYTFLEVKNDKNLRKYKPFTLTFPPFWDMGS